MSSFYLREDVEQMRIKLINIHSHKFDFNGKFNFDNKHHREEAHNQGFVEIDEQELPADHLVQRAIRYYLVARDHNWVLVPDEIADIVHQL
ncbi:MAG: hypothetical protein ACI86H_000947 [bacterium]|jgi:hypothetical protein